MVFQNIIQSSLYKADMLHSENLYLTDTFLGTKPETYGQILIKKSKKNINKDAAH